MTESPLEALRAAFHEPPSASLWERVADILDPLAGHPDLELALNYAADHLASWSPSIRRTPRPHWLLASLRTGEPPHPAVELVNTLGLDGHVAPWGNHSLILADWFSAFSHYGVDHISTLELAHHGLDANDVEYLGESIESLDVRHLSLRGNHLGFDGAAVLLATEPFAALETLDLGLSGIGKDGDPGLSALGVEHVDRPHLVALDLSDNALDGDEVGWWIEALPALQSLRVDRAGLGASVWTALVRSGRALRALSLCGNALGDDGLDYWLRSGAAASLEHLELARTGLGEVGALALARAHLPNLRTLVLSHNALGDGGAVAVARSPVARALRRIGLAHCGVSDAGASALSALRWPALESLDLSNAPQMRRAGPNGEALAPNALGDRSVPALANLALSAAPALRELNLAFNLLEEIGPMAEAGPPHLRLEGNPLTPASLDQLAKADALADDLRERWARRREASAWHPDYLDNWSASL